MTVLQRVRGEARVVIGRAGLRDLAQRGSAKAMLPRVDGPDPEVVFLNTAGGVTGGDRLDYGLEVGAGARVTGATQTAERAYRSAGGAGRIDVTLNVGAGGHLDWLPQETILFEGSAIRRETRVDLAPGASLLMVESVVLGRAAMGEEPRAARLDDIRRVFVDGRLAHEEHLALDAAALGDRAALGDARALASLVVVGPAAEDALAPLRATLPDHAAASAWDGRLVARFAHREAAILRRALINAIVCVRGGPMPRVWQAE